MLICRTNDLPNSKDLTFCFSKSPIQQFITLFQHNKEADNHCEECNTLNQSGCNNHSGANITTSLGLTGHTFHSALTDFTNTDTGTDSCQTSSDSCAKITPSHLCGCL